MDDATRKAAIATIVDKRDALLKEKKDVRAERERLAARDREIDRELADCRAAARVFGLSIDFPAEDDGEGGSRSRLIYHLTPEQIVKATEASSRAFAELQSKRQPKADAVIAKQVMPRIGDIVLDRLKAAGSDGSKAAPIQQYIETTYATKVHEKTVGMTLYRLSKEGKVRRDGHTWFFVPAGETKNPGVVAPGSEVMSLKRKEGV